MNGGGDHKYSVSYEFKDSNVTYKHKFEGLRKMIIDQYETASLRSKETKLKRT